MLQRFFFAIVALSLFNSTQLGAQEDFVGSFAEPRDGGNIDTARSTFDGATVTIIPRSHPSEAIGGGTRWRNVLFAIRGVQGKNPAFVLPLTSPGTGKTILSGDLISFQNIKLVWSYQPNAVKWNAFDQHTRTGTSASNWKIESKNTSYFAEDVVYVSINEHFPVADFYEWLEADVFTNPLVKPTPSEVTPGTFVIGYQSGATSTTAFARTIPDMPLFGFVIKDPTATATKLVMLVSGQHPYEGQNKVVLQAAVDWILHSSSAEAKAYRANYTTIVYPFVNPTGEMAGLWRGTAYQPMRDTNRNWHTTQTLPSKDRGIDTVIVHKNAMKHDIATLGLGEPYATFDYHQNFGDRPGKPDYILHSSSSDVATAPPSRLAATTVYTPYFARISQLTTIAEVASDLTGQETLRGYMISRGATLPLTFERSVYHTIGSEWTFGVATVQALVEPGMLVAPVEPISEEPAPVEPDPEPPSETDEGAEVVEPQPAPEPVPDPTAEPDPVVEPEPEPASPLVGGELLLMYDEFTGSGSLNGRTPDMVTQPQAVWSVQAGNLTLDGTGAVATSNTARAVVETSGADVEAVATLNLGANDTGIILRSSNQSNFLRFTLNKSGWFFQKTAAGVTTIVARGQAVLPLKTDYAVTVTLQGPTIVLRIDGVVIKTITETFNQTATRHGIVCSNTGARSWKSFSVRKL